MKTIKVVFWFAAFILFANSCQYGDSNTSMPDLRKTISLNNHWNFCVDSTGRSLEEKWYENSLPKAEKRVVNLPHTWNIEKGLERYFGNAWYEKIIYVPEYWKNKIIRLKFGGINRNAIIYVNGDKVKEHLGAGYTTFYVDITNYINIGNNTISISVDNAFTKQSIPYDLAFDWANDGGIYRDVELIVTNKTAIDYIHLISSFKQRGDKNEGTVKMKVKMLVNQEMAEQKNVVFQINITEENQNTSDIVFRDKIIFKQENGFYWGELQLNNVNLWHFDHPNLYKLDVWVLINNKPTDNYATIFGFKELSVNGTKFVLNGEKVRLPGLEWMSGSNPDKGFAEDMDEIDKMLSLIKKTNAVFVRFHWQQDKRIIDWCNRNGILVQEEIPHWQLPNTLGESVKASIKTHIDEMIVRDFNDPCIFSWGIGNELHGQSEEVYQFLEAEAAYIKSIDSMHLISYTSSTLHNNPAKDATQIGDFLMWNDYQGTWHNTTTDSVGIFLNKINKAHPEKPIVISEFGLCEPQFKGGDKRRIADMKTHIDYYFDLDFLAGAIYFSLNDYRTHFGESGKGRYRQRIHGVTDFVGKLKPSFTNLRDFWSPIEIVRLNTGEKVSTITLKCKEKLPAYSVKGYSLVLSKTYDYKSKPRMQKDIPELAPGEITELKFSSKDYKVLTIIRPTRFSITQVEL